MRHVKDRTVLITGAAGAIGTVLKQRLKGRYRRLVLADIEVPGDHPADEVWTKLDVLDRAGLVASFESVDAIVHLATAPLDASWDTMQRTNVDGTWNVFEMAAQCRVARMVYTSSNHITGYHRRTDRLNTNSQIRPDSHYGVTKAFGEATARMFADKKGLSTVVIRIGSFQPAPKNIRMLSTWLSHNDAEQLFARAIETPGLDYEAVYGVSANTRSFWQPDASPLNYRPTDNAEDYAADVFAHMRATDEPELEREFQGGDFCSQGYSRHRADNLPGSDKDEH